MRHWLCVLLCLATHACGEDEPLELGSRADFTPDASAGETRNDSDFDLAESRSLQELQDPETRRALCTLLGVVTSAQAGLDPATCEGVLEVCEQAAQPLSGDSAAPLPLISNDLSGLLDCPATATDIDACLADLLRIARDSFGDLTCSNPALSGVTPTELLGSLSCGKLLLICPNLLLPLLQALQP